MQEPITYHTELLIVGAGGAGLAAAVLAAEKGIDALCVSKVPPLRSHTIAAQGGINAALGMVHEDDWRWHVHDTLKGGDGLSDLKAVELLCSRAPEMIRWLESVGMQFSRTPDGDIYQRPYGGQTTHFGKGEVAHRACASEDRTGQAMLGALYKKACGLGVLFHETCLALDLLMDGNRCIGLLCWDMAKACFVSYYANHVILATGGGCQMYHTTTVARICTGDGNAMALRAGFSLQDMEFIQFHPTGLHGMGILVTEAARAEGGMLVNGLGERFLARTLPDRMELSPRDVIARAIAQEVAEGRGCGELKDHVELRLDHLDSALIDARLPMLKELAEQFANIDIGREPIPVSPSAHYMMGGIPVELDGRVKGAEGLYAIGETACVSVHGANRLGCNSLLELVVFAHQAIESLTRSSAASESSPSVGGAILSKWRARMEQRGDALLSDILSNMQMTMQQHVGVFRSKEGLLKAKRTVEACLDDLNRVSLANAGDPYSVVWQQWVETYNLALQAKIVTEAALAREESRGAHYRHDFPEKDERYAKHSIIAISK